MIEAGRDEARCAAAEPAEPVRAAPKVRMICADGFNGMHSHKITRTGTVCFCFVAPRGGTVPRCTALLGLRFALAAVDDELRRPAAELPPCAAYGADPERRSGARFLAGGIAWCDRSERRTAPTSGVGRFHGY